MKEYDRDSFWKIDKLVPKKSTPMSPFATKGAPVLHEIAGEGEKKDNSRTLTIPQTADVKPEERIYERTDGLVRQVRVRRLIDKFDFHANFVKAARLYYTFSGKECPFAKYYSYMPQYVQLNEAQKNYYFFWRSELRQGRFIKTDYSYLYLYVFEIINLPDVIAPCDGVRMLALLWREYRRALPNIDRNMALWLQDYCLLWNVECPTDIISDFIFSVQGIADIKEFYLSDIEKLGIAGISSLVSFMSDYDWRTGRYAGEDNKEAYAKHMLGALGALVSTLVSKGELFGNPKDVSTATRPAFRGALISSSIKYELNISYVPICTEPQLRNVFTSAVKYTENKLRALLGVKSRLAVKSFSDEYRECIDSYFTDLFDKVNRERKKAQRPEYEKYYESEDVGISATDADEIERSSWSTTARLVEDIEEYVEITPVPQDEIKANVNNDTNSVITDFVRAALDGITDKMNSIAAESGELVEALVERVNDLFTEYIGDVVFELSGEGYQIIEDYREDVEEWLMKTTR